MKHLAALLSGIRYDGSQPYYIPACWNHICYPCQTDRNRPGEVMVEPAGFYRACLESICDTKNQPAAAKKNAVVYSMLPRAFCGWNHTGELQNGSFLKCIALLPLLKRMGVDILYLLPVFEPSRVYLKGNLPSPYAIRNIYAFDPDLADPAAEEVSLEVQFSALVEACHHLGMRVMLDFVFRTAARDNVLVREHPDWFYWVRADGADTMAAPGISGLGHAVVSEKNVRDLYRSPGMKPFLQHFVFPPKPDEWSRHCREAEQAGENIMTAAAEKLGICTLTGFADTINDPQPPWTDVTYYRFYFDQSPNAALLKNHDDLPPFIVQDGVKCSLFPGKSPNTGLWDYLSGVLVYYIDRYSIDGARIDMAHALPKPLIRAIIRNAKRADPDFLLWSEEFSPENAFQSAQDGYHFILGNLWAQWQRITNPGLGAKLLSGIDSALPVVAATEMADSPRAPVMTGSEEAAAAAFMLCALLPNSYLLINNGQECGERQPMNLGLLNDESGRYALEKSDPMYGKLAFFDRVMFHWADQAAASGGITLAIELRKQYASLIQKDGAFCTESLFSERGMIPLLYRDADTNTGLCALFYFGEESKDVLLQDIVSLFFPAAASFSPLLMQSAQCGKDTVRLFQNSYAVFTVNQPNETAQTQDQEKRSGRPPL